VLLFKGAPRRGEDFLKISRPSATLFKKRDNNYISTSTHIFLAVHAMIFIQASTEFAFRSDFFNS
jgi:hypothetical protein